MTKVILPVRVARVAAGAKFKILEAGETDGGWSTIECDDAAHARQIMRAYPNAEMPCWRNPSAAWNQNPLTEGLLDALEGKRT